MLSLGVTLVVSLSAAPLAAAAPATGATCGDEPAGLEMVSAPFAADADDDAPAYATPVEVECPTPAAGGAALADATCDESPPPDLWYRISTAGAIERATSTVASGRRAHGRATLSAGGPAPDTRTFAPPDSQPVALCAVPVLLLSSFHSDVAVASDTPPARSLAPPDRPPRV